MDYLTVKDATQKLGVEAHVLRYWEEELGLAIKRNSLGHRYYEEKDIRIFEYIKELKETGLSLKEIKEAIQKAKNSTSKNEDENRDTKREINENKNETIPLPETKIVDFKQAQLQAVMNKVVANALRENKDILTASIKQEITTDVMRQFDAVMREKEYKEEARFKRIDEYLRQLQQVNEEVAATKAKGKFRMFGRKK